MNLDIYLIICILIHLLFFIGYGILLLDLVDGDCITTGWTVLAISALIVDPAMVG